MPERRDDTRPGAPDRRSFPRPPLWLNLLLLLLGIGVLLYARYDRQRVSARFAHVINEEARAPADVKKMKEELAALDLSRTELQRELQGRMKFMASLKSENFYLSIDTQKRKMSFYYGDMVLRESGIQIGDSKAIKDANGKSWTFIALKGAFPVEAKAVGYDWRVPEWVYAMNQQPVPAERPTIANGLGKFVIFLPNGYVIHSTPSTESPLKGPKPGSILVPDEDLLAAIWPRIHKGTQVYIF